MAEYVRTMYRPNITKKKKKIKRSLVQKQFYSCDLKVIYALDIILKSYTNYTYTYQRSLIYSFNKKGILNKN